MPVLRRKPSPSFGHAGVSRRHQISDDKIGRDANNRRHRQRKYGAPDLVHALLYRIYGGAVLLFTGIAAGITPAMPFPLIYGKGERPIRSTITPTRTPA